MEHREDGLLVDFSGTELTDTGKRQSGHSIVYSAKQEAELKTLDQETKLMRAMNEIREYTPKKMSAGERDAFAILCQGIFAKYGLTDANYREYFGHLGVRDQLHR